ncbi:importin-13 [Iris pallida]|uniref:Importin-13 n=1 Tax=Iris pallida TaxID=29817 RepID=A0AAX6HX68_IRIPA|nr:importin-13 [Iris pallida]
MPRDVGPRPEGWGAQRAHRAALRQPKRAAEPREREHRRPRDAHRPPRGGPGGPQRRPKHRRPQQMQAHARGRSVRQFLTPFPFHCIVTRPTQ